MSYVYIGTFGSLTARQSEGIYCFACEEGDGQLRPVQVVPLQDPSYLTVSRRRNVLYAATHSASFEGQAGSGVVAFAIDPGSGKLTRLGSELVPSAHAGYIGLDRDERFVLVACGLGGAVAALPIDDGGRLLPVCDLFQFDGTPYVPLGTVLAFPFELRAGPPLPHCIRPDIANRHVLVPNLGHNRVHVFDFDAAVGRVLHKDYVASPPDVATKSPVGARHLDFHPDGTTVYVNNETHSSVTVFEYASETGALTAVQTVSTLRPETPPRHERRHPR